jgi:hypothetical protein
MMHAIWDDEPLADTRRSPTQFLGAINITTLHKIIHLVVPTTITTIKLIGSEKDLHTFRFISAKR